MTKKNDDRHFIKILKLLWNGPRTIGEEEGKDGEYDCGTVTAIYPRALSRTTLSVGIISYLISFHFISF